MHLEKDWLLWTLLLSAVFNMAFCDDPDIKIVKKIISSSNQFLKESNLMEVELEEFSISPVDFMKGRLGFFASLELVEVPVSSFDPKENEDSYYFFVYFLMKNLTINYQYVMPLPLIYRKGEFSINLVNITFSADIDVLVGKDGNCSANLKDARVFELEDFKVKINPQVIGISFLREFYEYVLNKMVHNRITSLIDHAIEKHRLTKTFKQEFKSIVSSVMNEIAGSEQTEQTSQVEPSSSTSNEDILQTVLQIN